MFMLQYFCDIYFPSFYVRISLQIKRWSEEEEEREMECDIVQIICHFGVILVCRLVVGRRKKRGEGPHKM